MGNQPQTPTKQATSTLPQRPPLGRMVFSGCLHLSKNIIIPVIVSVVVAFSTATFMGEIEVPDSAAHSFLTSYYSEVINPADRQSLFNNKLTANSRSFPGHDWNSYERFWASQKSVSVDSVIPVQGDSSEFTVVLTYEEKGTDTPNMSTIDVWLQCHGNILTGRVPGFGCSQSHLEIDNTQPVTTGSD